SSVWWTGNTTVRGSPFTFNVAVTRASLTSSLIGSSVLVDQTVQPRQLDVRRRELHARLEQPAHELLGDLLADRARRESPLRPEPSHGPVEPAQDREHGDLGVHVPEAAGVDALPHR